MGATMLYAPLLWLLTGCIDNDVKQVTTDPNAGHKLLEVSPSEVDFGVSENNAPLARAVDLTATGDSPVSISSLTMQGSSAYTFTWPEGDVVLQPGQSTEVVVTYTPLSAADEGKIVVESDAESPYQEVPLVGGGTFAQIEVDPSVVYLSSPFPGSQAALVHVRSIGTMDLVIDSMLVQGDEFAVTGSVPITLAPGAETELTVVYTPLADGETASGELWLTHNTATGFTMVPLRGQVPPPCIGLGEAWDKEQLDVEVSGLFGSVVLHNLSDEEDICIDNWYVYLSDGSQDAGAGDPNFTGASTYPNGTLNLLTSSNAIFNYANPTTPAWWCMEHAQSTSNHEGYEFTGARVPEALLGYMLAGDQDGVWAYQDANSVVILGRDTNYVAVEGEGLAYPVSFWALNMGESDTTANVQETVPAGFEASDFSVAPLSTIMNEDGSVTYSFELALPARVASETGGNTGYSEMTVSYVLTSRVPCSGRINAPESTALWRDSSGTTRTSTANPLVLRCS